MKRYSLIVMAGLLSAPVAWASTPAHGAPIPGPISPAQAVQRLSPAIRKLASPNRLQVRRLESNLSAKLRHTLAAQPQQAMQNLVSQRSQILRLLGVPANKTGYVYYFVSTSMPTALLKAYARDAIWDGGMLVFRGIVPGHGIGWFLRHVMLKLKHVTVDGSTPTVTIDPNLYDAYGVRLVPAIVYSAMQPWETCAQTIPATLVTGGKTVRYHRCAPEGAKSYWKVSGAVSTWYALSRFHAMGAPGTGRLLRAMRAGAIPAGSRHEAGLTRPAPGPGNLAGVLAAINGKAPRESAATLLAPGGNPQQ
ncbi:MAG: TrbC family F-type conjugative pilus assembly protein [Gammaproteobacteria bacterium]|jgi:type-F conjugative transfer system pilin assembly protein TrbC|nr:TrbC family F-type conjugative pilus assembly protein [Gammaproteobacteria bacterium]